MKRIINFTTSIMGLILIVSLYGGCETTTSDENSSDGAGVLDNNHLYFDCYVDNVNTGIPIQGVVVEWDRVGNWPGSIVYPISGTTDAKGFFSVDFNFPTSVTSWNLNVKRAYTPAGGYNGWTTGIVIPLSVNNRKTLRLHLYPLK